MPWYVVQTKPKSEQLAVVNLQRQGYTIYCPMITQRKRRRNRWQDVTEALFPRYLFVQLQEGLDDFSPIRSTIGVSALVRFGGVPAVMPEQAIEMLTQQEERLLKPKRLDWKPGSEVEIREGPMAGLRGIFQKTASEERVIILLALLGKQSRVVLDSHLLAPI